MIACLLLGGAARAANNNRPPLVRRNSIGGVVRGAGQQLPQQVQAQQVPNQPLNQQQAHVLQHQVPVQQQQPQPRGRILDVSFRNPEPRPIDQKDIWEKMGDGLKSAGKSIKGIGAKIIPFSWGWKTAHQAAVREDERLKVQEREQKEHKQVEMIQDLQRGGNVVFYNPEGKKAAEEKSGSSFKSAALGGLVLFDLAGAATAVAVHEKGDGGGSGGGTRMPEYPSLDPWGPVEPPVTGPDIPDPKYEFTLIDFDAMYKEICGDQAAA